MCEARIWGGEGAPAVSFKTCLLGDYNVQLVRITALELQLQGIWDVEGAHVPMGLCLSFCIQRVPEVKPFSCLPAHMHTHTAFSSWGSDHINVVTNLNILFLNWPCSWGKGLSTCSLLSFLLAGLPSCLSSSHPL